MKNMNVNDKLMNRFFRKVDGVVWDLFSGRIGVKTEDGITTIEGTGEDAQITVNMFDQFGMAVPAFAQSTPVDSVKVGDLIYGDSKPKGWIISVNERAATAEKPAMKRFGLMTPGGTITTWTPPKVSMLGFDSGVMVLRSLVNMLPGGEGGLGTMQNMLMPMMMMGGMGGDSDGMLDQLMPMMLFSQLGASGTGADAAGASGMGNMMQMMMMMKMMGGKSGSPFGGKAGNNFFDN
jgi:hypothetical protein